MKFIGKTALKRKKHIIQALEYEKVSKMTYLVTFGIVIYGETGFRILNPEGNIYHLFICYCQRL